MRDVQMFGVEVGKGRYHEEAFYGIALTYTVLFNKVSKYLDAYGLTPAKLNALMVIRHQGLDAGLSHKEIGSRLMVTASNMTRLLEKLDREKLIEHSGRAGDKRVKVIRISRRGADLLDQAWPGYVKTVKDAMDRISPQEQKILAGSLLKLFQRLSD